MTEVLLSKDYRPDVRGDMEFGNLPSSSTNVDTDESPCTVNSPRVDQISRGYASGSSIDSEKHCARRQQDQMVENEHVQAQLSLIALLLAAVRRSGLTCQTPEDDNNMEIGWPTNVRHVTHVTFDRFNGFLGLPVEFEMEMPRRVPSASASVFGVSAESMQCSYDRRGNSVPTILLLLQERLYHQGGLQAEGIFRINPENSQEEHVRDQLNRGNVPADIDVHCLAGLIKAWLRELPRGVLDSLPPEQFIQCQSEEQCFQMVKLLPPMQAALLDWAVNLMADVVQEETTNKMNARNVAMVFAPNMTQMSDPLTALMHAVQVMNFLKTLILKTLQDRQTTLLERDTSTACSGPPKGDGQEDATRGSSSVMLDRKDGIEKEHDKFTHCNGFLLKVGPERKSIQQDKTTLAVEERFLRGFSGKDTADDVVSGNRRPVWNGHSVNSSNDYNGLVGLRNNPFVPDVEDSKSTKTKHKGGRLMGRIDQHSDGVEAW